MIELSGSATVAEGKARMLTIDDLGLSLPATTPQASAPIPVPSLSSLAEELEPLEAGDPILVTATRLLEKFGGLILTGPPGTSKSWYASRLAITLAGDVDRVRLLQFHPSYQYEDFVIGYVPREDGSGFDLQPKHLMQVCAAAVQSPQHFHVLVIDELSRGDPGRVFGEALTYVEASKRGRVFRLASGHELQIPRNVVIIATMNPLDRGVDEVDAAFERRFAKIRMDPDEALLDADLQQSGMDPQLRRRLIDFFRRVQTAAHFNPAMAVGHTYFFGATDSADLRAVWNHQLQFHFERAFRLDPEGYAAIEHLWETVVDPSPAVEADYSLGASTATTGGAPST